MGNIWDYYLESIKVFESKREKIKLKLRNKVDVVFVKYFVANADQ